MSKKDMIAYITSFNLYPTMNSWNQANGYSINCKIHQLPLSREIKDKLYDIIADESLSMEYYDRLNDVIRDYEDKINEYYNSWRDDPYKHISEEDRKSEYMMKRQFEIGFNGRSGGHLVLYKWNGANYCGTGWSHDSDELEELDAESVKEVYKILRMFEACYKALIAESKYITELPVEEVEYQPEPKSYKQFAV